MFPKERDPVFDKVQADYLVSNGTRVSWELQPSYVVSGTPYFSLLANVDTGNDEKWVTVAGPTANVFSFIDTTSKVYGKDKSVVYQVQLTDDSGTYTSEVATTLGSLSVHQWNLARAIGRRLDLQVRRMTMITYPGYLLKRKLYGTACTCIDTFTGQPMDTDHAPCQGTGIVNGYWAAVEHTRYNQTGQKRQTHVDGDLATTDPQVVQAVFYGLPSMNPRDVWVDANSNRRYVIREVTAKAEMNQVPLLVDVTMKLAPATDIIYSISVGSFDQA